MGALGQRPREGRVWKAGGEKGIAFYKWLADKGWNEAEAIKNAAGDKGSKAHYAIVDLIDGKQVAMDAKYPNPSTGQEEELSLEEYECLMSFAAWFKEAKPKILARETVVWNDELGYAGTIDCIAKIGNETYLIDFKTGQNVWPEPKYELQVSAYKHAQMDDGNIPGIKLAILQLGYRRNKAGWKFTEVEDKCDLFLAARQIWQNESSGDKVSQKDYPLVLSLAPAANEAEAEAGEQKDNAGIQGDSEESEHRPEAETRHSKGRKGSGNGNA